jgi:hypothetical protein
VKRREFIEFFGRRVGSGTQSALAQLSMAGELTPFKVGGNSMPGRQQGCNP